MKYIVGVLEIRTRVRTMEECTHESTEPWWLTSARKCKDLLQWQMFTVNFQLYGSLHVRDF